MAKNVLHFEARQGTGKSVTRKLRKDGKIPAVVYGRGEESYSITVDAEEFKNLIAHLRGKLMITGLVPPQGDAFRAAIKAIQRHPLSDEFLNVDFQKIHPGEMLHVSIPIVTKGTPVGLKTGGILDHIRYEVDVRGPVEKLPLNVDIDISHLELGEAIRIRDLKFEEGIEVLDPPQAVIVTIASPRRVVEVAAAAEGEEGAEGEEAAPAEGETGAGETESKE